MPQEIQELRTDITLRLSTDRIFIMNDEKKTKKQLIDELVEMRKKISELEESEIYQKQIYESLTQSEQRYKTLVETIPHGVGENDTKGIITFSNPVHSRMTGYNEGDLVGKAIWDMHASAEEGEALRQYLEILVREQSPPTPYITQVKTKDGRVIDVQVDWNYKRDKEGNVTGFISIITDITELKRTTDELQKSYQLLEKTFASLNDAVFIINADPVKIIDCNPAASKMFGYSREEMIGRTTTILHVDEISRQELRKNLLRSVEERGFLSQLDFSMRRKDGTVFPTDHSVFPLEDASGTRIGWVSVVRDITERKKAEKEMIKLHNLESVGVLAGGIAHDFNNFLAGILGNIELAKLLLSQGDNISGILTEAENASLRAKDLTRQLLTFSKGGEPVKKTISIGGLIKEWCSFTLRGSRVRYECIIPDTLWPVEVEEGQIHQVISNIIINADQAMSKGGIIKVQAENITVHAGGIPSLEKGRYVKISIEDQGVGIPEKHLQKIFDPFFTTKEKGSGLGLAIAYSIVKKHNGHICVESEPGVKTTFYVYIPASSREIIEEKDAGRDFISGQGKILVMDDEEIIREFAGKALRHLGYDIEFAKDGIEAVESYRKAIESGQPFDAVIMDLIIAGSMGGEDAIKELLRIDPRARVIVSSGYSKDPIMANYKDYGFRGGLVKPYTIDGLSEVVHRVIKGISE